MCIYIITDDSYFFTGLKGIMVQAISDEFINLKSDSVFASFKVKEIESGDVFVIASDSFTLNLSLLLYLKDAPATLLLGDNKANEALNNNLPSAVIRNNATAGDILTLIIHERRQYRNVMFPEMTERERAVLLYTLKGIPVKSISSMMEISIKTIYAHRKNGFSKVGARNIMDFSRMENICAARTPMVAEYFPML